MKCLYCQNSPWSWKGEGRDKSVGELAEIMRSLAQDDKVENWNLVSPTPYLPFIREAAAALAKIGKEPVLQNGGGGSDANIFNEKGVPALLIAAGYNNAHTPEEYVSISGMCDCADFVAALAEA